NKRCDDIHRAPGKTAARRAALPTLRAALPAPAQRRQAISRLRCRRGCSFRSDDRAHVDELRKERVLERALEKGHAAGPACPCFLADDALDRFEMAEAPKLKALVDIDQLFAHLVGVPVAFG